MCINFAGDHKFVLKIKIKLQANKLTEENQESISRVVRSDKSHFNFNLYFKIASLLEQRNQDIYKIHEFVKNCLLTNIQLNALLDSLATISVSF